MTDVGNAGANGTPGDQVGRCPALAVQRGTLPVVDVEFHELHEKYRNLRIEDKGAEARLLGSLGQHGQQSPALVVAADEGGFVLIDGYRRAKALRRLKQDTMSVLVLPMNERDALLYRQRQEDQRPRSAIEEGWLLHELVEKHELGQDELSLALFRSRSWVCRRLALVEVLPVEAQAAVRAGKVCPHGAMRFLVPLARANRRACITLVGNLKGARVSSRQVELLYRTWRTGTDEQRAELLARPLLLLKAVDEVERADPCGIPCDPRLVIRDLRTITTLCQRACRQLGDGIRKEAAAEAGMERSWDQARVAFKTLWEALKRQGFDAVDLHTC